MPASGTTKTTEKELEKVFKALANKRRISILRLLKARGKLSVGVIADEIKLSFNATSKHLGQLYSAGFIEKEQRSLAVYCELSRSTTPAISHALAIL